MDRYRVIKLLEQDYMPIAGREPFAVCWGADGWVIWCRVLVKTRVRKVKARTRKGKNG